MSFSGYMCLAALTNTAENQNNLRPKFPNIFCGLLLLKLKNLKEHCELVSIIFRSHKHRLKIVSVACSTLH